VDGAGTATGPAPLPVDGAGTETAIALRPVDGAGAETAPALFPVDGAGTETATALSLLLTATAPTRPQRACPTTAMFSEQQRLPALHLCEEGYSVDEVAVIIGCSTH